MTGKDFKELTEGMAIGVCLVAAVLYLYLNYELFFERLAASL